MEKTREVIMRNKEEKGNTSKKSILSVLFASILKFNLAVAILILLALIVNAGDTTVETGSIFTEKNNELFLSLKNTETGGHDYRLVSAGSAGGIGNGKFGIYDATAGLTRLVIDSNGKVGIGGITDRLSQFTIQGRDVFEATGTVSTTQGSPYLTGSGTRFTSEIGIGDIIFVGDAAPSNRVVRITDDTHLTMSSNARTASSDVFFLVNPTIFRINSEGQTSPSLTVSTTGTVEIGSNQVSKSLSVFGNIFQDSYSNSVLSQSFSIRRARYALSVPGDLSSPYVAAPVRNGDFLWRFLASGYDGNRFVNGAMITARVDGVPGVNDMPASLSFFTTPDNSIVSQERIRITNSGNVGIGIVAIDPKALLHVNGEIIVGNSGAACNADKEGAIRYNYISKVMEFCDGASWRPI